MLGTLNRKQLKIAAYLGRINIEIWSVWLLKINRWTLKEQYIMFDQKVNL